MPLSTQHTWHKLAASEQELLFSSEGLATITVAGKSICFVNYKNELYGCTAKCPHAGGELAQGYIDALGHIVCPLHRYKFDIKNGRNISGEGYFLKTYPVQKREDGIYIGL